MLGCFNPYLGQMDKPNCWVYIFNLKIQTNVGSGPIRHTNYSLCSVTHKLSTPPPYLRQEEPSKGQNTDFGQQMWFI